MPKNKNRGGPPPSRTPAKKHTSSDSKVSIDNDGQDVIDTPERPVWSVEDLENDEKETDEESMSLTITMKLAHELSLLKGYLENYEQFNIHLGGKQRPFTLNRTHRRTTSINCQQTNSHQTLSPDPATKAFSQTSSPPSED